MFLSFREPDLERKGNSASQHCKQFPPPALLQNPVAFYPSKVCHLKQYNPHNFRVRKNKCSQRTQQWSSKRPAKLSVSSADIEVFFRLLEDSVIGTFLERDVCRKYADKYLIAMTFTYFIRAHYSWQQYTRYNFFVALYLAHDMEEDEEEFKFEILPWLYGDGWRRRYPVLLRHRDLLWRQVMAIRPSHQVWLRERPEHHSGALRNYTTPDNLLGPFGPHRLPPVCRHCTADDEVASDDSGVVYLPDSPAGCSEAGAGGDGRTSPGLELSDSLLSPASDEIFIK